MFKRLQEHAFLITLGDSIRTSTRKTFDLVTRSSLAVSGVTQKKTFIRLQ